jgi:hypothetical protein
MTVPPGWFCALALAISSAFDTEICRMVETSPLIEPASQDLSQEGKDKRLAAHLA